MVGVESVTPTEPLRPVTRRRVVSLAVTLACALVSSLASPAEQVAAEKEKKKKRKSKGKSKGKGKNGKNNKHKNEKNNQKRGGGGQGQAIVKFAQKHKGAQYVWGGESPNGFDCSGFTWYVYSHAANMEIGRTEDEQWKHGRSVSRGALQPGDLVFFENTFEHGLSHVGIFVSGSNFIHAENESTGVVISSLDSDYYRSHYAGARRLV
jgi:cell wall-associated NlpC family hydrolase